MKKLFIVTSLISSLVSLGQEAELESENAYGGYEFTFGGGGENINGESYFGLDFSVSTNPLKIRPEIWVGVNQSLYWEPGFGGSTDIFADWSQNIWKEKLYANVGWSGGALYSGFGGEEGQTIWRTGPELTFQLYFHSNTFLYAGVNYDVFRSDSQEGSFRYSFGIGIVW